MKPSARRSAPVSASRSPVGRMLMILVPVVLLAGYYSQQPQHTSGLPVTYRIGSVDGRFGLSASEVSEVLSEAASVWEKASNRELFKEDASGVVVVNFVYDYRQAAADKLKSLSGKIGNTKGSYDFWKERFETLKADFERDKAVLEGDVDAYNARISALNAAFEAGRKKGGVSEDVYRRLMEEKDALDGIRNDLERRRTELNDTADTLNSIVVVINEIATNLNLNIVNYNNTGSQLRNEFSEGLYEQRQGSRSITVYHFTDRRRLVRVLAHELGHALGIQHNKNPEALMYRVNQSDSLQLAPEDIAELKQKLK